MVFKGRIVIAFILLSFFAGSLLTVTLMDMKIDNTTNSNVSASAAAASAATDGLTNQDIQKIQMLYELIRSQYIVHVNHDTLLNGALSGMITALNDPYSDYMTPEQAKQFQENVAALFEGIGVNFKIQDGKVMIDSLIKDMPAEKAGVQAGDMIVSVNDQSLNGLTSAEVGDKIRGLKGSQVKLEILRKGVSDPIAITIVRGDIQLQTVIGEMLPLTQIGKIVITQFSTHTANEFKTAFSQLESMGMKGLIIDVRNNPGGYLDAVLDIAQPFIPSGQTIFQREDRNGKIVPEISKNTGIKFHEPVVVLINKGSASAAEILAAALQQSAGSKLVGETTYGKGTIQDSFDKDLGDGSNLKLTIEKWLTPNGAWINQKGLTPDIDVAQPAYFDAAPLTKNEALQFNMNNTDIKNMQMMLAGNNLNPGRMDGYFDNQTKAAVKQFQQQQSLPATGVADAVTMKRLEDVIIAKIDDPKNDTQLNMAISTIQQELMP